jgi:hypothetical protein
MQTAIYVTNNSPMLTALGVSEEAAVWRTTSSEKRSITAVVTTNWKQLADSQLTKSTDNTTLDLATTLIVSSGVNRNKAGVVDMLTILTQLRQVHNACCLR